MGLTIAVHISDGHGAKVGSFGSAVHQAEVDDQRCFGGIGQADVEHGIAAFIYVAGVADGQGWTVCIISDNRLDFRV